MLNCERFWFRRGATNGAYSNEYVTEEQRCRSQNKPQCRVWKYFNRLLGFYVGGWTGAEFPFSPVSNAWYFVAGTYDQHTIKVYLNGIPVASQAFTGGIQYAVDGTNWLGNGTLGANSPLDGAISDIRVYNRALSDSEIQQLFTTESAPILNVGKAVYLTSSNLWVGTNYQIQISTDLNSWTNFGVPFTATNSNWRFTNYWDVDNWGDLFFRLQVAE